jgi:hypothetical protein
MVDAEITNIDEQGRAGNVVILLYSPASSSSFPMVSVTVRMPTSEPIPM